MPGHRKSSQLTMLVVGDFSACEPRTTEVVLVAPGNKHSGSQGRGRLFSPSAAADNRIHAQRHKMPLPRAGYIPSLGITYRQQADGRSVLSGESVQNQQSLPRCHNHNSSCCTMCRPMFSDAVAAGDGALHTFRTRWCRRTRKSSTRFPDGARA